MKNRLFKLTAAFLVFMGVGNNYCPLPVISPFYSYSKSIPFLELTTKIRADGVYEFFMSKDRSSVCMQKVGQSTLTKFNVGGIFCVDPRDLSIDLSVNCDRVVISYEQNIKVFNAHSGELEDCMQLPPHLPLAFAVEYKKSHKKRRRLSMEASYKIRSVAFSDDSQNVVVVFDSFSCGNSAIGVFSISQGTALRLLAVGKINRVQQARFLPNGDIIMVGDNANVYTITNEDECKMLFHANKEDVFVALSPDGRFVAVRKPGNIPESRLIEVWDVVKHELAHVYGSGQLDNMVTHVAFLGNTGKIVVYYFFNQLCEVHDLNTGKLICQLDGVSKWFMSHITCDEVGLPFDNKLADIIHLNVPVSGANNIYCVKQVVAEPSA